MNQIAVHNTKATDKGNPLLVQHADVSYIICWWGTNLWKPIFKSNEVQEESKTWYFRYIMELNLDKCTSIAWHIEMQPEYHGKTDHVARNHHLTRYPETSYKLTTIKWKIEVGAMISSE